MRYTLVLSTMVLVGVAAFAAEYRGSFAGHMVTADQQPVPGITVELISIGSIPAGLAGTMPLRAWPKQQAVTDAQGAFRFDNLSPGEYGFKAETATELASDTWAMFVVTKKDGPDTYVGKNALKRMNMSLELEPAEALAGRVIAADGQPAAGAEIYPYSQEANSAEAYMFGQKCGNDGTFSFPKLKKGRCQFSVSVNGGQPVLTDWFTTGDRNVEIRLAGESGNVPPEQQQRLERMKSEGANASLTILPVRVGGNPFDRVAEFVGMLLEQQGLKKIELGKTAVDPGSQTGMGQMAVSLSEFVRKNPVTTGYALYAEFNNNRGLDELRAIVVDKTGALVWSGRLTPQDKAWKEVGGGGDLMVSSTVLARCLMSPFGLNEETAKAAKPGKMAAIMAERSGQPPENETAPIAGRLEEMKKAMPHARLVVFPVRSRVADNAAEAGSAAGLAKAINDAGLCKAEPARQSLLLKASQADPNLMKVLWDLAREFREYLRKNPVDADYVLYADYRFNPQQWEAGFVHFIVCNRQGEWVIADQQNSDNPAYQSIKPVSKDDCDKVLVKRLASYLH